MNFIYPLFIVEQALAIIKVYLCTKTKGVS